MHAIGKRRRRHEIVRVGSAQSPFAQLLRVRGRGIINEAQRIIGMHVGLEREG